MATRLFNHDSGGSWWDDLFGDDDDFPDVPDMPGSDDDDNGGIDFGDFGGFGRGDTQSQQTKSYNVNLNLPTDLDRASHAAAFAKTLAENPFAGAYVPDWYAEYAKGVDRSGTGDGDGDGDGDGGMFGGIGGSIGGGYHLPIPSWPSPSGFGTSLMGRGEAMGPETGDYVEAGTGFSMSPSFGSYGGGSYGATYPSFGDFDVGGFETEPAPAPTDPYAPWTPDDDPFSPAPAPVVPPPIPGTTVTPPPPAPVGNAPGAEILPDTPDAFTVNSGFDDPFGRFSNEMSKAIDIRGIQEVARATTPGLGELTEQGDWWNPNIGGEPVDEYGALWANPGLAADDFWNMSPAILQRLRQLNAAGGVGNDEYDFRVRQYLPGGSAAARVTR